MIKSMTGYGSAKGTVEGLGITVELKSVNNRYLDASVRMPRSFLFAEDAVKSVVQKHISRGKVDVFVSVDSSAAGDMSVKVNEPLLRGYVEAIRHIAEEYSLPDDVTALSVSRFPDVLTVEKNDIDAEAISQGIVEIAELALQDFDAMRLREGEKLRDDVSEKLASIDALVTKIEKESPKTVAEYRARLEARMAEVLGTAGIEESRILAEAAVFADHVAVDEETVRLRSHMSQLKTMLSYGKKDRLPHPGVQPRSQHHRLKVPELRYCPCRCRPQVRDREDKRTDTEHRVRRGGMKLVSIGFGNLVSARRIISIVSPESAPIKRMIQEVRERGLLIDASFGRSTKSVIVMDSGNVILSALPPETVAARCEDKNGEDGKDEG